MNRQEILELIDEKDDGALFAAARKACDKVYGKNVFFRGLVEFTNHCKNGCYYCGLRAPNQNVHRYRLDENEILSCVREGSRLGFHSFVLQGGEDPWFDDGRLCQIVSAVKKAFPNSALTLSVGERSRESYQRLFNAGADRYLLRHETACGAHYKRLHPKALSLENRKQCLWDLKEIGYQVGSGFMVGSPWQTRENLAEDILFLQELAPHMVGIGPFIPQSDTPFAKMAPGTVALTLKMIAITRLALPWAMLPATTALGTIDEFGREKALLAGANVVMPNLSPLRVRKDYALYDNKIATGIEGAENCLKLKERIEKAGFIADFSRGDCAIR